ncbi:hypothetical protein BC629DRAFT_192927 [Irpex lacteus]|nr:hypothetical protein BC629DRAFT_192927 [Irpex lacteus]
MRPQAAAPPIPSPEQDRHTQQQIVSSALQKLGFNGVRAEDLQKLNPSNRYEDELALMGEVRAYFKIAYSSLLRQTYLLCLIAMAIDQELLHSFADELYSHMIYVLGLNPSAVAAKCAEYLAEDLHIVAEREECAKG